MKKTINVIVPAYNEEECIEELAQRLQKVFETENEYIFKVIIVENGSTDNTWIKLKTICTRDSRFSVIRLSRNFRMDG